MISIRDGVAEYVKALRQEERAKEYAKKKTDEANNAHYRLKQAMLPGSHVVIEVEGKNVLVSKEHGNLKLSEVEVQL